MSDLGGAIAATRFGLGARPGEIAEAASDPRGWLKAQIRADAAVIPADGFKPLAETMREQRESYRGVVQPNGMPRDTLDEEQLRAVRQQLQRDARESLQREAEARGRQAASTRAPFAERWARFWANHFTVAARNAQTIGLAGPFEREAVRPHVFGSFAGLLGHATFHPGMLVYLDNNRSVGPSTQAAQRRELGLNENLAREVLELHTLGVGSGYTQADIVEFAKALTGWTTNAGPGARLAAQAQRGMGGGRRNQAQPMAGGMQAAMEPGSGETVFLDPLHEPGARTVLGKTYPASGREQAAAILNDLARHPATAKHVAVKLARHFVADEPPASAVGRLSDAFTRSGGDLAVLARAVIDLDEAWAPKAVKFKTPEELMVSAARAVGPDAGGPQTRGAVQSLGQRPYGAPSPAGWPDDAASWSGSDAVMKRLEWANAVSRRMARGRSPTEFLDAALGPLAGEATRKAVARAESAEQGFTLALMSPEFQRR